jgi:hypothetical protein
MGSEVGSLPGTSRQQKPNPQGLASSRFLCLEQQNVRRDAQSGVGFASHVFSFARIELCCRLWLDLWPRKSEL